MRKTQAGREFGPASPLVLAGDRKGRRKGHERAGSGGERGEIIRGGKTLFSGGGWFITKDTKGHDEHEGSERVTATRGPLLAFDVKRLPGGSRGVTAPWCPWCPFVSLVTNQRS